MLKQGHIDALAHSNFLNAGSAQIGLGQYPQQPIIPMQLSDWKKLKRETQIKVLDELGLLSIG